MVKDFYQIFMESSKIVDGEKFEQITKKDEILRVPLTIVKHQYLKLFFRPVAWFLQLATDPV